MWHTDKNFCFYAEVNFWDFVRNDNSNKGTTARLNETRFGPKKKSSPIYLDPKNLDTFWCTGWAWNCQIIFRCASIHGRAGFILISISIWSWVRVRVFWIFSVRVIILFLGGVLLVWDSSAVRQLFVCLLEPWDVRELYIRKTADLPLQLLVSTFPRFVAIGFYFLSGTLI